MAFNIAISDEAEARLAAKAKAAGVDVATNAARQLERLATETPNLAAISGPICEAFAQNGVTEDELSEFLEVEKHQMRVERRMRIK